MARAIEADPKALDAELARVAKQLSNLLNLGAETGDKAILDKIRELEARVAELREQKAAWVERVALKKRLLTIDTSDIRTMLSINGLELREGAGVFYLLSESEERRVDAGDLRRVLHTLVDRVELDPKTRKLTVHYRLNVRPTGVKLASPRDSNPGYRRERATHVSSSMRLVRQASAWRVGKNGRAAVAEERWQALDRR